jgi:hypothetical protein
MNARKLLHWKTALIYLHRWMGIAFGLVFAVWFVSGIAMIYVGMPHLSPRERLGHVPPLDISTAVVAPADAAARFDLPTGRLRVEMFHDGRPIYRFSDGTKVYADTGDLVPGASKEEAVALVRRWVPRFAASVRYDARITEPDQWTLYNDQRAAMPLHRIRVGDPADTHYYVSETTGEPTMKTDRRGRTLGYLSAVLHWTYFTALRRNGPLWLELVAWGALAGVVMCVAGMVVGVVRVRLSGYRLRAGRSYSPYATWLKWHHYAGLIFGVATITWAFSGAMSLGRPFPSLRNQPLTASQRTAVAGAPLDLAQVTLPRLREALDTLAPRVRPKQIDIHQLRGTAYVIAYTPPDPYAYEAEIGANETQAAPRLAHLIVPVLAPATPPVSRFHGNRMWDVAKAAMPGVPMEDAVWLSEYDAYYYDQDGVRPLPVLRVRYSDADATWLYLDPALGTLTKMDRGGRWNRWLYHGLHNLDFPFWYYRRPLWDIVMIGLSLGGLVLSASTLVPSFRRLARHAGRLRRWRPARGVSAGVSRSDDRPRAAPARQS